MYKVDLYLRVRRAVMVDGMSIREVSREFGLHRDTARIMLAYSVPPGSKPAVYTAIQLQIPLLLQLVTMRRYHSTPLLYQFQTYLSVVMAASLHIVFLAHALFGLCPFV